MTYPNSIDENHFKTFFMVQNREDIFTEPCLTTEQQYTKAKRGSQGNVITPGFNYLFRI